MSPRQEIRFCNTTDGVQLAMALASKGPPIVRAPNWLTHIEGDPASLHMGHWIEEFSRAHTCITYDARGCGLSSRQPDDISFEAWVRDLETVVDALGLHTFPLVGFSQGAAIAIAYAARHPERVSRLILFGGFATSFFSTRNPDPRIVEEAETLLQVMKLGWGGAAPALRQVFVANFMPGASIDQQRAFDDDQQGAATAEVAVRSLRQMFSIDVKEAARDVGCPALVFHASGDRLAHFQQGRKLAALIPGARFIPVDSVNHLPFHEEPCWPGIVSELRDFLGSQASAVSRVFKLTQRQVGVLCHVATGKTDKQIARVLSLSPRTVEMHVAGAMRALGCATRAEAVHRAGEADMLQAA